MTQDRNENKWRGGGSSALPLRSHAGRRNESALVAVLDACACHARRRRVQADDLVAVVVLLVEERVRAALLAHVRPERENLGNR